MKDFFKAFFGASSKEVNGIFILVVIFILTLAYPSLYRFFAPGMKPIPESDAVLLDSLVQSINKTEKEVARNIQLFVFNPNLTTKVELMSLGFSDRTSNQIINYRTKGGRFKVKNDLYKIYSIDSVLIDTLYDFIDLPVTIKKKFVSEPRFEREKEFVKTKEVPKEQHHQPSFDINMADTSVLQTIVGIGPVLSNRIVTFRDKLGGFVTESQLYEVYNLDSSVVNKLFEVAYIVDAYDPRMISINSATETELADHPYISNKKARLIVAYRNQHGDFESEEGLLKVYSLTDYDLQRLSPYIQWSLPE